MRGLVLLRLLVGSTVLTTASIALPYVDCNGLIPEEVVLAGQKPVTDQGAGALSVKQILALPTEFRSLILINRRLILEAKAKTFVTFVSEVRRELPQATRLNARMMSEAILIYCEQTMVNGPLKYSPKFYKDFYSIAAKARFSLAKSEQLNDVMVFLDAEPFGTRGGGQINWDKAVDLSKRSSSATRVNLAKRAVLGHLATRQFLDEIRKGGKDTYSRELVDHLIAAASESKAFAPSVAVLKCLVLAVNGEKAAAKKLANQYRTNESLNIHYREGLLEMAKTGDWKKLRKAMDQPFILGWKKGD